MNQARDLVGADWAHNRNIYGENIGVAIVDTGVSDHVDLIANGDRITAFKDTIHGRDKFYDDNGHGTHVAGIIGGDGFASDGLYRGMAPKCNIISVKVLNHRGNGNIADVLTGLKWIVENKERYNIRVVNISVGASAEKNADENSNLVKGVDEVWDSGIVVVVAAGNNGPKPGSISMPGISRKVITVGASDDDIAVELSGNTSVDYSGRGPTGACIKKPDIVAPGCNIISCNAIRGNSRDNFSVGMLFNPRKERTIKFYTAKSGTSMATPIVSGAIALLLSVYPNLTNKEVKMKLRNAGVDLGFQWSKQGWGLLNVKRLLE